MKYNYNKYCKHYQNRYEDHCKDKYDDKYYKYSKNEYDDHSIEINVNCSECKKDEKKENIRLSAFRAVNTATSIPVPANTNVKVLYSNEQYDLANEYNTAASTFIPAKKGIYSIIASVGFIPNNVVNPYRVLLAIRVNGVDVARDNDFFSTINFRNDVTVSTNIQLNAGDIVEIFVQSSVVGSIGTEAASSRFEATRFPSPAN